MLAEVRLSIGLKEARLLVRHGDDVVEDELWSFAGSTSRTEAKEVAKAVFDTAYDLMNLVVNGDG